MIALLRSLVAVILGYVVFAVPSYAIFPLTGHAPHQPASVPFMVATTLCGIAFALAGGYVAAWLAGRHPRAHGLAVAALLAAGATASLVSTLGHGAIWTQLAAIVLMAPSAALGGTLRAMRAAERIATTQ